MNLEYFDATAVKEKNPWIRMEAILDNDEVISPLDSVALSSDGTMVLLDSDGKAYSYNWDEEFFVPMKAAKDKDGKDLALDSVAVGNRGMIFAIDTETKSLYQHTQAGWERIEKDDVTDVAVGVDGTLEAGA